MIRAIGFGLGVTGAELRDRAQMSPEDLLDVLNALLDAGFAETASMREHVDLSSYEAETFEVNPSYAMDLKAAVRR